MAAPAAVVAMQADLQAADEKLRDVKSREQQLRLSFAFLVAVAVSAVGVRVLNTLLDAELTSQHVFAFAGVDILLTAGVLTGGTAAINTISGLLGTYVETTRKRALER